jgi:hypothetical protein
MDRCASMIIGTRTISGRLMSWIRLSRLNVTTLCELYIISVFVN